jgi:hypothetical protein
MEEEEAEVTKPRIRIRTQINEKTGYGLNLKISEPKKPKATKKEAAPAKKQISRTKK